MKKSIAMMIFLSLLPFTNDLWPTEQEQADQTDPIDQSNILENSFGKDVIKKLRSDDKKTYDKAVRHIARHSAENFQASLPALLTGLSDSDTNVRFCMALSISLSATSSKENGELIGYVTPDLIRTLGDEDHRIREHIIRAIGSIHPHPPETAIQPTIDMLSDPTSNVRRAALDALGKMKLPATTAASILLRSVTQDESPRVRGVAVRRLAPRAIQTDEGIVAIALASESRVPFINEAATRILEESTYDPHTIRTKLKSIAEDQSVSLKLRQLAHETIAKITEGTGAE